MLLPLRESTLKDPSSVDPMPLLMLPIEESLECKLRWAG